MENVRHSITDNQLTLWFCGRVDSSNAADVDAEVVRICDGKSFDSIVLDADELLYISSAGLRVVLRLRKSCAEMKIINASTDVYEIFEITGFTEMIPVEKAYRKLSIDGCEVIGQGANGKVYRLDEDTIIKVYLNPNSLPEIHRERELARKAFVLGIPTAIPYDVVKVEGSYGSVFEMLNAKSFSKLIAAEPENADRYIAMYAELLKKIHSTEVKPEDMPDMKAVVLDWADFLKDYLPADKWQKLHDLVEAVPEDHHMIHGDYHTKNVMMQNGEALLIDMDTLAQGNPIFEFASVYNAYIGFAALDHNHSFLGLPYDTMVHIWEETLHQYFGTDDKEVLAAVEDKAALIGYTRLMRRLIRRNGLETEEGRTAIEYYKNQILERLDRVDSLVL